MWPFNLSVRLPIVDLVGRYPANYLIGREPIFQRIAPLATVPCSTVVSCGISVRFQTLSPSERQVAHALLTRPPLRYTRINSKLNLQRVSPFDLHVLGTPPAFVLSQDQTLIFKSLNDCSFLFKIFVSKFIACELTSLFVWVFTPAHFSETLFSFQGTTSVRSFTSDSFYIISNSFVLCQELF